MKAEFGDGSGARDVLSEAISADITDADFEAERGAVDPPLRTHEELAYYRVWREHLAGGQRRADAVTLRACLTSSASPPSPTRRTAATRRASCSTRAR